MKQRNFLGNLAFLLVANLLVKPFWILGVDRTVQNTVGASDYGIYFALLNFSFLYAMLLDFGMANFNNRAIARNAQLLDRFLPSIFVLKGLFGIAYLLLSVVTALLMGFEGEELGWLGWLLANQVFISFTLYFRSNLAAQHHFKLDAVISVLDRVLMIGVIGVMLWAPISGFQINIEWFIYGQTACYATTTLIALAAVRWKNPKLRIRLETRMVKRILKMSYPFALLGLLMTIYNRVDGIMIERLLGGEGRTEAGIYAASYRLLDAANMIGFAFASILLPMFARMLKRKESIKPLLEQSYRTLLMLSISVAVIAWFFQEPIMDLLYPAATVYWSDIFGLLMISFVGVSTMYAYGSLLTAHGSLRALNWIGIAGVAFNVFLNLWLINEWQAYGATVATVITQGLVAVAHIVVANRIFKVRLVETPFIRATVFAILAILVTWGATHLSVRWTYQLVFVVVALAVLAMALRMLRWWEWKAIFTERMDKDEGTP